MKFIFLILILFITSCTKNKDELYLFSWCDFISEEVIRNFEKEYNCKVIIDCYDSNESMYAKLRAGGQGYDIVFPTLYFEEIMANQDLIENLDFNQLPLYKNIDWDYLKTLNIHPSKTCIPYMLSFTGIGYRKDRVKPAPISWTSFANENYKGRMTMLNDVREAFGVAFISLGKSVNTRSLKDITQAEELLLTWKKNLAKFESEQYKNGIASAEYLLVQGYSSDLFQVMQENEEVEFVLPIEGAIISCDMISLLNNQRPKRLAYLFINYLLRPEVALKNMKSTQALSPNREAMNALSTSFKKRLIENCETLKRSQIIKDIGKDQTLYFEAWERIKESS